MRINKMIKKIFIGSFLLIFLLLTFNFKSILSVITFIIGQPFVIEVINDSDKDIIEAEVTLRSDSNVLQAPNVKRRTSVSSQPVFNFEHENEEVIYFSFQRW